MSNNFFKPLTICILFLILMLLPYISKAQDIIGLSANNNFKDRCLNIREIEFDIHGKTGDKLRDQAKNILNTFPEIPAQMVGDDVFMFYQSRLQLLAGNSNGVYPTLISLASHRSIAPESLRALEEYNATSVKIRIEYENIFGALLPTSGFGELTDLGQSIWRSDARLPIIPTIHIKYQERIAELFFEMSMFVESKDSYAEAVYSSLPPQSNYPPVGEYESWLSPKAAPLWLKAAQSAWYAGDTETMYNYLAKAIIFGDAGTENSALQFFKNIKEDAKIQPAHETPSPILIREIVALYVKMNMHPRAIALIEQYHQVLGDNYLTEKNKCIDDWNALLNRYCYGVVGDQCIVFGQNVLNKDIRDHMIIPFPCSDASLKLVTAALIIQFKH